MSRVVEMLSGMIPRKVWRRYVAIKMKTPVMIFLNYSNVNIADGYRRLFSGDM